MSADSDHRKADISRRVAFKIMRATAPPDIYISRIKINNGYLTGYAKRGDGPYVPISGDASSRSAIKTLGRLLSKI